jgi:hypothetical protein
VAGLALLDRRVFDGLVLWCCAEDPGQIADPATACHDALSEGRHNP